MTDWLLPTVAAFAATFGGLAGIAVGASLPSTRARILQNEGEAEVRRTLAVLACRPEYHLMNNITIPYLDGTTQIDHILVSTYGIFVVETKHYTGWVFGDARSPEWTQVIYERKFRFQNPLHQNAKHVRAVRRLLPFVPEEEVRSVVVFSGGAELKTRMPSNVVLLEHLEAYLGTYSTEVLSLEQVWLCIGRIEHARRAITRQTDVEHQAYLEGRRSTRGRGRAEWKGLE
ncbi:MAG: nuclease-related domain-containing protein [Anaerosomatales bacterium]|nr:nuclease-related domain-containing protein [Anaerosomatales bacterium]